MSDIAVPNIYAAAGPETVTELVAALHRRIVDIDAAARSDRSPTRPGPDYVSTVVGAAEPPD